MVLLIIIPIKWLFQWEYANIFRQTQMESFGDLPPSWATEETDETWLPSASPRCCSGTAAEMGPLRCQVHQHLCDVYIYICTFLKITIHKYMYIYIYIHGLLFI